jgi:hypothetical protein
MRSRKRPTFSDKPDLSISEILESPASFVDSYPHGPAMAAVIVGREFREWLHLAHRPIVLLKELPQPVKIRYKPAVIKDNENAYSLTREFP